MVSHGGGAGNRMGTAWVLTPSATLQALMGYGVAMPQNNATHTCVSRTVKR